MTKRLFHFSNDPKIGSFEPRSVRVSSTRPEGMEWLNGPLVWAIDDAHSPLYLFPRECPRIIMWRTNETSCEEAAKFLEPSTSMTAYVEKAWEIRIEEAVLFRYELPTKHFISLDDVGMHVARTRVRPLSCAQVSDLPNQLAGAGVALRTLNSLTPLRDAWSSSLHVSGIRLRNAVGWAEER